MVVAESTVGLPGNRSSKADDTVLVMMPNRSAHYIVDTVSAGTVGPSLQVRYVTSAFESLRTCKVYLAIFYLIRSD